MTEYEATEIKLMDNRQVFPICKRSGEGIGNGDIYVEVMVLSDSPRRKQRFEQWLHYEYIDYLLEKQKHYAVKLKTFLGEVKVFKERNDLSPDKIGTDETSKVETDQHGG